MLRKAKKIKNRRTKPIFVYKAPEWFLALPYKSSDHGSNAHQKRLWRLVSEYVRERDFKKYGKCVACSTKFSSWQEGQAGHFRAWSVCNGMFKYYINNLALMCGGCNSWGDGLTNYRFGEEMKRRYGNDHADWVQKENMMHRGERCELPLLVEFADAIIRLKSAL